MYHNRCYHPTPTQESGKNQFLQSKDDQSPNKRLKSNISDLFLQGIISGKRACALFTDAADAQAEGLENLQGISQGQNALRDLQRKLSKSNPWPPLFPAKVHLKHLPTDQTFVDTLHMLLPHEICSAVARWNQDAGDKPFTAAGLTPKARQHFLSFCQGHNRDPSKTFPLGFWIDGVPVKWDRSESMIVLTLNFPGQVDNDFKRLRIPIPLVNKKFLVEETMQDLLNIIAWSFTCLHAGFFPSTSLPGQDPFHGWRQKQCGKPLGAHGMLIEARGDWEAYKNFFGLAGWNDKNCCYRCQASLTDIRDPSLEASWRSQRKTLWRHFEEAKFISPLFSIPGVNLDTFVIDWLHCMDLGMGAEFAGNLLYHVLPKFPGNGM